jgi:tRNA nucleotidyltransferase (CCA-adding enzyme)
MTVGEAFEKFKTKISVPTQKESGDASRRQNEIRELLDENFDIERDFLTGSYARHTKTKPLKDVDIFCVLGPDDKHYRDKEPNELLKAFADVLEKKYGRGNVGVQRRSVGVNFGTTEEETVMSFDVVPAFTAGKHYRCPIQNHLIAGQKPIQRSTKKRLQKSRQATQTNGKPWFAWSKLGTGRTVERSSPHFC